MSNLSPQQRQNCVDFFKRFDKSGDGKLSIQEVVPLFRALGLTEEDYSNEAIIDWFLEVDKDGSRSIDLDEFLKVCDQRPKNELTEGNLRQTFKEFDKDGSGNISATELKQALAKCDLHLSDCDIDAMIKSADTSGDGQISVDEFLKVFRKK